MVREFSHPEIVSLDRKPVMIITDSGIPISVGRVQVATDDLSGNAIRVELEFETERLRCALRVTNDKWRQLLDNWDGEMTQYVLPHGDGFWLDERETSKAKVLAAFLKHGRDRDQPGDARLQPLIDGDRR